MSSRQIRRLVAEKEKRERDKKMQEDKEKEEEKGDEGEKENEEPAGAYSPHVVRMNPAFEGLEVSSGSESEPPVLTDRPYQDEAAAVIPEEDKYGAKKKIFTNDNNKKQRKNKKKSSKKPDQMDEVEWSLKEVNRMLGSPPEKKEEVKVDREGLQGKKIFAIHPNHINVNYELAKVFGEEERIKKVRNGTRRNRHEIGLSPDVHPFRVKGLTMTRYKTEGDVKFFKFTHTQDYKARCHTLVEQLKVLLFVQGRYENNLHPENCVEALLENCDVLYYVEEHKGANQSLEQAIYFMQSVGEASFNFVDGKSRLPYEFVENRPLHIAILKYLHVLTNIACHRTALELAKVLLNLDPTDPLAVIFIIDTLAIRAREHQWLLDLIEYWREKRQAHRLFHMRYSRALALFHVAYKNNDFDGIQVSKLALMKAMKYFPPVAANIMDFSNLPVPAVIRQHAMFGPLPNVPVSHDLNELMVLYAWLVGPRWREPQVWKWFMETVTELIELYDKTPLIQEEVRKSARLRGLLYRRLPLQMKRHLYAIRPMAQYISEGRMPHTNLSVSFNPFPAEGAKIDTYKYFNNWEQHNARTENALMSLIQGIYPDMYQIGRRNMGQMLEMMDGMEIRVNHGSYLVIGPRVINPGVSDDLRTYRVVFVQRPPLGATGIDPVAEFQNAVEQHGGSGVLLNQLGIPSNEDDATPLLNRMNLAQETETGLGPGGNVGQEGVCAQKIQAPLCAQKVPEPEEPKEACAQKAQEPEDPKEACAQKAQEPEDPKEACAQKAQEPEDPKEACAQKAQKPEDPKEACAQKAQEPEDPKEACAQKAQEPEDPKEGCAQKGQEPEDPKEACAQKAQEPEDPKDACAQKVQEPEDPKEACAQKTQETEDPKGAFAQKAQETEDPKGAFAQKAQETKDPKGAFAQKA